MCNSHESTYGRCLRMRLGACERCARPECLYLSLRSSSICIWPLTKRVLTRKKSSTETHATALTSQRHANACQLKGKTDFAPAGMTIHNKFHVTNANRNCGDGLPSFVLSESNVLISITRL